MHTHTHACTHTRMHTHTHARTYARTHTRKHARKQARTHTHAQTQTRMDAVAMELSSRMLVKFDRTEQNRILFIVIAHSAAKFKCHPDDSVPFTPTKISNR